MYMYTCVVFDALMSVPSTSMLTKCKPGLEHISSVVGGLKGEMKGGGG